MSERISAAQFHAADGVADWRVLLDSVHATYTTGSFAGGVELVRRVGELADAAGHHPDVDLRYGLVHLVLSTHDAGGLTEADVALARQISAVAGELGVPADPAAAQVIEIAIDAVDRPGIAPFWRAVLGYEQETPPAADAEPAIADPARIGPAVWFQQMDAPRPQRNRIHLDVTVAAEVAESRVAAAVAAGGHLVTDSHAPSFWVLADAEGNEACVCTWRGRDEE